MEVAEYVERRLAGSSVAEVALELGITPRHCLRLFQKDAQELLTKSRYIELRVAGYSHQRISNAHGYSRRWVWTLRKAWGIFNVKPSLHTAPVYPSLPDIQTTWGKAVFYQGYYRIPVNKGHVLWDSPLRGENGFVLLHRIVALEDAILKGREDVLEIEEDGRIGLKDGVVVHHVDGDRTNNRIENLTFLTRRAHSMGHWAAVK